VKRFGKKVGSADVRKLDGDSRKITLHFAIPQTLQVLVPFAAQPALLCSEQPSSQVSSHFVQQPGFKMSYKLIAFHLPHRSSPYSLFCHHKFSDFFVPTRVLRAQFWRISH